ncbi:UBC-like protein [Mollisia scopiformis]|uniref:UBC-like protein n=1 Tax=Mollisia scopiformis TaxID=149040 RepID=A0A132B888_MOLSC|nr:UBC-like protein [Mollisia scopiformis]KUJ08581.1 UBC-like protein [Mollisia scopiformis]
MSALMKEIASLTTSLPPGIFLKISESRPDVMKALIAGVEGSVYEGGLFAFDIALPQDWPVDPPRVHFVLEGHDSHRDGFNPNLYATGELCLSLLNTFPACSPEQKWQPNRSTLSSVFVSIQAMILGTSNPHANEVGCDKETEESSAYARQYNDGARRQVVQYAILYWLRSSSAKRSIWYDIAEQYYKNKRKEVIARVKYLGGRDNEIWMAAKDVEKCLGGYSSTSYQSRHR